jgi:hypothetical protein
VLHAAIEEHFGLFVLDCTAIGERSSILSAAAPAVNELLVARLDSPLEIIMVKKGNFSATCRHC